MSFPFCLSQFCCWAYFNQRFLDLLGFNSLKLICLIDISTINVFYYILLYIIIYLTRYIYHTHIYIYSSPFSIQFRDVRRTAGDASQLGVVAEEFVYAARMWLFGHPGQPLGESTETETVGMFWELLVLKKMDCFLGCFGDYWLLWCYIFWRFRKSKWPFSHIQPIVLMMCLFFCDLFW
jgi:hypothetical protein